MNQIRSIGDTMMLSLQQFFAFLPSLVGAILLLIIGWIVAGLLAKLIEKGLSAVGFETAVQHSGIGQFIHRSGSRWTASKVLAELTKWFIFLIFVQAAANVLQMPQLTQILNSIVLFIPNVIVAVAIIVIGSFIARFLSGLVRASVSEMGVGRPKLFASMTNYAIIGFSVIAAVNQLGVATTVVNTLFIGLIASMALAVGLAFGLGGKDVASEITQTWYEGGKKAANRMQETSQGGHLSQSSVRPLSNSYPSHGPVPQAGD